MGTRDNGHCVPPRIPHCRNSQCLDLIFGVVQGRIHQHLWKNLFKEFAAELLSDDKYASYLRHPSGHGYV